MTVISSDYVSARWGRRKRGFGLGVICLIILAFIVPRWFGPPTYRVIGRYDPGDETLVICSAGFAYRERNMTTYVLRDWIGHQIWRATPAIPADTPVSAISPNGHYFALGTISKVEYTIECWLEGRHNKLIHLPGVPYKNPALRLHLLNDGRLYAWYSIGNHRYRICLIQHGNIIATGELPFDIMMTPDGKAVVPKEGGFVTPLTITGKRIMLPASLLTLSPAHRWKSDSNDMFCAGGRILTASGALYDTAGELRAPGEWEHVVFPEENGIVIADDGRYVLEWRERDGSYRLYSPETQLYSNLRVRASSPWGIACQDGRHALVDRTSPMALVFDNMFKHMHLPLDLSRRLTRLTLVDRPGHMVAVLNGELWENQSEYGSLYAMVPSPDGRSFVISHGGCSTRFITLFRW